MISAATWESVPSDMCAQVILKSACASAQFYQSSRSACRNFAPLTIQNAPIEELDHSPQMIRLIQVLSGRACQIVCVLMLVLTCLVNIIFWGPSQSYESDHLGMAFSLWWPAIIPFCYVQLKLQWLEHRWLEHHGWFKLPIAQQSKYLRLF